MGKVFGRDDKAEESAQTSAALAEAPDEVEKSVSLDAESVPIANQEGAEVAPEAESNSEPMAMVDVESKLDALGDVAVFGAFTFPFAAAVEGASQLNWNIFLIEFHY